VYGQLVSPDGSLIGNKITIAADTVNQYYPDVVWDGNFFVVIWREGNYYIKGQRIDSNGQLFGTNFAISATSLNTRLYPAIAASNMNYLVAWSEYRNSLYNIWGNVDQVIGIDEQEEVVNEDALFISTIISGQVDLPKDRNCRVYDISGRVVEPLKMGKGIYFIEIDGKIIQKVVKVR
jgi:hypothetical protein